MHPPGAATLSPLPSPPAERQEGSKPSDPSDGRFASLMAQYVPPQGQVQGRVQDQGPAKAAAADPPASPQKGDRASASGTTPAQGSAPGKAGSPSEGTPAATKAPASASPPNASAASSQSPASAALASTVPSLPAAVSAQGVPAGPSTPVPNGASAAAASAAVPLPDTTATRPVAAAASVAPPPEATPSPGEAKADALPTPLLKDGTPSQEAPSTKPSASASPAFTAALALGATQPRPAPAPPPSLSGPTLPAAPSLGMAAVASASGATSGTGPAPGATEALSAGSLATKLEGTPSSPDASGKANPGPSVQIQVASDGGAQTALVASTRPVPVAEAAPAEAAPPPAPAAPAPVAAPPVAQVDSSMRWMLKNGAQEAQLQLHPDALGQVTIHLRVEGGEVHARLWVSEPAAMQAVQNGRSHLELSLKEQGLQLGSFDLQQGNRPFQDASAPQGSSFQEPASALVARQETPAVSVPSLSNPHQIEFYA